MFNKITIKNFKSLADTSTELGRFTVLVGANGSGKSSFLQAIELVSWAVRSPSINDELQANNVEFRDLVHLRASKVAIGFKADLAIEVPDEATGNTRMEAVEIDIELAKRRFAYIKEEFVRPLKQVEGETLPYGILSSNRSRVAVEQNGEKPRHMIKHDNVSLGHSMLRDVFRSRNAMSQFPVLYQVARHFADYVHYEIWGPENLRNPTRGPFKLGAMRLGKRGEDLPGLLHRIRLDEKRWPKLISDLQEAYPRIQEITFKRGVEVGELGLIFHESSPSKPLLYRPSQMSDGFMRLLALLALKHQPRPLTLLGYEEPENGLHPSALDDCMRHLKAIARNGTQVIVTTHSPYLLNHLLEDETEPRAELRLVIRDKRTGRTTISPPDPEKVEHARKQGFGIGELWGMLLDEKELAKK
jgi:predicted ATPase